MEQIDISLVKDEERKSVAEMLAQSEPWITLCTTMSQCLKTCNDLEYIIFVAHLKSILVGAIILHHRGVASSPYVKSIIVANGYRSHGIGANLMKYAENYFRKESKHMFLCVSSFNKEAQLFYNRIGYNKVGEFKDYIIEGESEILMHKRLR